MKVFGQDENPSRNSVGVFARVLIRQWPDLPVAEEGWLKDAGRCRDFFERVLRHHRRGITALLGLDRQQSADLLAAHRLLLERLRVKS